MLEDYFLLKNIAMNLALIRGNLPQGLQPLAHLKKVGHEVKFIPVIALIFLLYKTGVQY